MLPPLKLCRNGAVLQNVWYGAAQAEILLSSIQAEGSPEEG